VAISKKAKADYDREYRKRNREKLKIEKALWFQRTYDPAKAAVERKKRMPSHIEYCRQPKYVAWKKKYDLAWYASKFGPFAEAWLLLRELKAEIKRQEPNRDERYRQAQRMQWNPVTYQRRKEKRAEIKWQSLGLNGL
jgi:hypothetical protein